MAKSKACSGTKSPSILPTILLLGLLLASLDTTGAQIGVCNGGMGDNLPSPPEVISLYKQYNIQRMRIYAPNPDNLRALAGSGIELIVDIPNQDIQGIASSQAAADKWVQDNIKSYPNVNFRYIAVGNEIKPGEPAGQFLLAAMQNIQNAISANGLAGSIKVSHATFMGALEQSSPPSAGSIDANYRQFLVPAISFLVSNRSPLLVNIYPYFSYTGNTAQIRLDYALFSAPSPVVHDGQLQYQNLFDAMLDAFYSALEKVSGGSLDIVVSESGWPTEGGAATSLDNARTYNNNFIRHVKSGRGSPKRPGKTIEAYIFAMFDENQKEPSYEKHWGLFSPTTKQPKYPVNFN